MFHACKVTVIKRSCDRELIESFVKIPEEISTCNMVKDNQEFYVFNPYEMPEGICPSAWADIRPYILAISSGGTFELLKEANTALATCTDLFRPVIFKIERVHEKEFNSKSRGKDVK